MPAVGEIYQVTCQSSLQGQTIENVIHMREVTGASTTAEIDAAAKLFFHKLALVLPTTQILTGIILKQMTPLAFDERLLIPTDATGAAAGSVLNSTISCVITKRTGVSGKTHRGRMYIAGVSFGFTDDQDRMNLAGAAAYGTFCSDVIATFGPSGTNGHLQFGVYSGVLGGHSPFTLAGWQAVTTLEPQIIFGNQRRRRVGVGI